MSTVSSEEGLRELLERVAAGEVEHIRFNEMKPKFLWYDKADEIRLIGLPDISVETRGRLAWALQVLTAAQDEETTLLYVFDGYHAKLNDAGELKKKDGTDWGYGGMQHAIENRTEDIDLVMECLNITAAQNGWVAMCMVPYDRTTTGIEFRWNDVLTIRESPDEPRAGAGGDFPTMLREATAITRMDEAMKDQFNALPEHFGLSEDHARLHMICAAVKFVGPHAPIQCAIPARSEEEMEILNRSFSMEEGASAQFFDDEGNEVDGEGKPVNGEPSES